MNNKPRQPRRPPSPPPGKIRGEELLMLMLDEQDRKAADEQAADTKSAPGAHGVYR
jgi:hypothetical protein